MRAYKAVSEHGESGSVVHSMCRSVTPFPQLLMAHRIWCFMMIWIFGLELLFCPCCTKSFAVCELLGCTSRHVPGHLCLGCHTVRGAWQRASHSQCRCGLMVCCFLFNPWRCLSEHGILIKKNPNNQKQTNRKWHCNVVNSTSRNVAFRFRHLFAIGSSAYSTMIKDSENQVIVIRWIVCKFLFCHTQHINTLNIRRERKERMRGEKSEYKASCSDLFASFKYSGTEREWLFQWWIRCRQDWEH